MAARRGCGPRRAPAPASTGGRALLPCSGERGQAAVELVLAFPLVLVALLAVVQVGLVVRDQVLVIHAAREAARAAAVDPDPGATRDAAESAGPLDPDRLEVRRQDIGHTGELVRVLVTYDSSTQLPLVGGLVGDVELRGSATMRVER